MAGRIMLTRCLSVYKHVEQCSVSRGLPLWHSSRIVNRCGMPQLPLTTCHYSSAASSGAPALHSAPGALEQSAQYKQEPRNIGRVDMDDDRRWLTVTWLGSQSVGLPLASTFPYVYLRDNCESNYSFHSNQRISFLDHLDLDVQASGAQVTSDGSGIEVTWSDGHISRYSAEWLELHCLSEANRRRRRETLYKIPPLLWDSQYMAVNLKKFKFADILTNDSSLLDWLQEVESVGLAVICDTPAESNQIRLLAERVPFPKTTHFGDRFDVKTKSNPTDMAYTSADLALHVDLPECEYAPCVQVLHCIKQSYAGGGSIFTDGFRAAEVLKDSYPQYFEILSKAVVDFACYGDDYVKFYVYGKHRTIQLDKEGNYERIYHNNTKRSSFLDLDVEDVRTFYSALRTYNHLVNREDLVFRYKMSEGDIICFNNTRVLHGRQGYNGSGRPGASPSTPTPATHPNAGEDRWLQGMFFDTDTLSSKRRLLKEKLGHISKPRTNFK